jgi:hypothetical protein
VEIYAHLGGAADCGQPLDSTFAFFDPTEKYNTYNDLGKRQTEQSALLALARILSYKWLSFPFFTSTPLSFVRRPEGGWTKLSFWFLGPLDEGLVWLTDVS